LFHGLGFGLVVFFVVFFVFLVIVFWFLFRVFALILGLALFGRGRSLFLFGGGLLAQFGRGTLGLVGGCSCRIGVWGRRLILIGHIEKRRKRREKLLRWGEEGNMN
jgi:hypothetical protein